MSTHDTSQRREPNIMKRIPKIWPVHPLKPGEDANDKVTCGHCGRSWDAARITSMTPVPSARCPFEYWHTNKKVKKSYSGFM